MGKHKDKNEHKDKCICGDKCKLRLDWKLDIPLCPLLPNTCEKLPLPVNDPSLQGKIDYHIDVPTTPDEQKRIPIIDLPLSEAIVTVGSSFTRVIGNSSIFNEAAVFPGKTMDASVSFFGPLTYPSVTFDGGYILRPRPFNDTQTIVPLASWRIKKTTKNGVNGFDVSPSIGTGFSVFFPDRGRSNPYLATFVRDGLALLDARNSNSSRIDPHIQTELNVELKC